MSSNDTERDLDRLFEALWQSYVEITPQANRVFELLRERGDHIVNDHVALRTFGRPQLGLEQTARPFVALGYERREPYVFEEKKLRARYFQHPDPERPKIFISELEVDALPAEAAKVVDELVAQVPPALTADPLWIASGRPWAVSRAQYETLAAVSEYAGWVAAYGLRANHFTVDVGCLASVDTLDDLVAVLRTAGFALNESGGVIKGGADVYLAQASTVADRHDVSMTDGVVSVPSCYVEFAERFDMPSGERFHGFVTDSADRIFESTDRR